MYKLFCFFFIIVFPLAISAQEFNYVQYDTKDGLAGSTVYDMCQDKDGFMWFATENGLTRFDGTHFKNFTVKEGLPDNEVIKLFADTKGRVWIGAFSKDICFYYKGNIYNKRNTKWLNEVALVSAAIAFTEDKNGVIIISDYKRLIQINTDNSIIDISALPAFNNYEENKKIAISDVFEGGFFVFMNDTLFKLENKGLKFFNKAKSKSDKHVDLKYLIDGTVISTTVPDTRLNQTNILNITTFVSTTNGSWSVDTVNLKLKDHFLPGKKVTQTIRDLENNLWFSTLGQGVYKLPSLEIKNIIFPASSKINDNEVFSLSGYNNVVVCGLGFSKVAFIADNKLDKVFDYGNFTKASPNNGSRNILHSSDVLSNGDAIFGFDAFLMKYNSSGLKVKNMVAIKSIDEIDRDYILVGAFDYAYKLKSADISIADTIYKGRCTKVFYYKNKYYIGTLNGLYLVDLNKKVRYLGTIDYNLSRRITDMQADKNGTIWIATNDAGVVGLKDGRVLYSIKDSNGLSSNICKTLYVNNNFLFVGTNKGLNKININDPAEHIIKYSASDGLPSDIINALFVKDSFVYVASPKGLTYFNENSISYAPVCNLQILNVNVAGVNYLPAKNYELSYNNNNISFEYVAISYKSGGDITYHYKLSGLDTSWKTTTETSLIYQTLPSGNYKLQLYATNKFGVKSKPYNVNFSISTPFWQTWWFYLGITLSTIVIIATIFQQRNRVLQARLIEKNNYQKQFAVLEQQALQAQMNPHFIFNCLNSIQQYILTNDKEKANLYLTGFASLIRQTLYISAKRSIKVSEEIRFLSKYLEMEKMRFGDSFIYSIRGNESMEVNDLDMPALLLQPYIENSLRHGIRYKQQGTGVVSISFAIDNDKLVCRIIDNGIGRVKAAEYKSAQHIEYQSKGMSLTAQRIDLLNKINDDKITIKIIDLTDDGIATGTEVIVQIPI